MKLSKLLIFALLFPLLTLGQQSVPNAYFQFPIQPGQINYLSGSMGELRASHFHAGLDIKTNGREGLNVYASAEGYISRIRTSTSGYGNAIYIQHPNGYTTVYAHLMEFKEPMATYVRNAQYSRESFEVELYPKVGELPITKGQVIALSGNTGSSGGPHLHFEIRNANQFVLDPLSYKFQEISDDIAPIVERFALRPMDIQSRVNDQHARMDFPAQRVGSNYTFASPIAVNGLIGIEILAHDKLNGAANKNGVHQIEMKVDGKTHFKQKIDNINFDLQRQILVLSDYATAQQKGQRFNKLYIDKGNKLNFYSNFIENGILTITNGETKNVEIILTDSYSNSSKLSFQLIGKEPNESINGNLIGADKTVSLRGGVLSIIDNNQQDVNLFVKGTPYNLKPSYSNSTKANYLWDLRFGIPDSIRIGGKTILPQISAMVPANKAYSYRGRGFTIQFPANAAFDDFYLTATEKDGIIDLGEDIIPFLNSFTVNYTPRNEVNNKAKTAIYEVRPNSRYSYIGGTWSGNSISFNSRTLGKYTLREDLIAPQIQQLSLTKDLISFRITDDLSGIRSFKATLNGKWILMKYESKKNLIWTDNPDPNLPFAGDLELVVIDNAGNIQTFKHKI